MDRGFGLAARLLLAATILLTGCGKGVVGLSTSGSKGAGEQAAITASPFADPLIMDMPADAYPQFVQLKELNGTNLKQTYGAAWEDNDYAPCQGNGRPAYFPRIRGYQFYAYALAKWLEAQNMVSLTSFPVTFPNSTSPGAAKDILYTCLVVSEWIAAKVQSFDRSHDMHGGIHVIVARRKFLRWTYENAYEADTGDKGKVQIFAATMAYIMEPNLPGVTFTEEGRARLKLMLNPDTGKWEVLESELHDPPLKIFGFEPLAPG